MAPAILRADLRAYDDRPERPCCYGDPARTLSDTIYALRFHWFRRFGATLPARYRAAFGAMSSVLPRGYRGKSHTDRQSGGE